MKTTDQLVTFSFYPNRDPLLRFFALWYFTTLLIAWTVLGHAVLGFEQSDAQPLAGVAAALAMTLLLEWVDAKAKGRRPRYETRDGLLGMLPAAIIPGLASAMLIYPNAQLWPIAFAAALSIASKVIFRAPVGPQQTQHVFNPSNFGITATLLLMPSVGLAPPYQFTENVTGAWHWVIPAVILVSGTTIHAKFTGRLPLVLAWFAGFALQGLVRAAIFGIPWNVPFVPMTSAAFILFTLYMIPDPATTPIKRGGQVAFGLAIAAIYGLLFVFHVVFGLFIALASVSALRGLALSLRSVLKAGTAAPAVAPSPVASAASLAG